MKNITLLAIMAFSTAIWAAPADVGASNIQREEATVTVTKILTAADEGATYRAYIVNWKGQEVVITDFFLQTDCKVGDKLNIFAVKHQMPGTTDGRRTISFALPPKATKKPNKAPEPTP